MLKPGVENYGPWCAALERLDLQRITPFARKRSTLSLGLDSGQGQTMAKGSGPRFAAVSTPEFDAMV